MRTLRLTLLALLALPMLAAAATETVRITFSESGLSIATSDPGAIAPFSFGPGPGNFDMNGPTWQPKSWIVEDWEHPADEPSGALKRRQVTFQLRANDATTRDYVVFFVFDPQASQGFVYLPAPGEPFHDSNVNVLRRERYDGRWYRATNEWSSWAQSVVTTPRPSLLAAMLWPARLDEPLEPDAGPVVVRDGVLELRGRIDAAMRERFDQAVATGNLTTLRITSHGGEILDALLMAQVIQSRGIDVTVRGLCTGACAQYLFVAGRNRKLEKRSLVGFMYTMKSSSRVLDMAITSLKVEEPPDQATARLAPLEEELYRRRGVSPALLMDALVAMQPKCVVLKRQGKSVSWNMTFNYFMWVPSREYLKAAGVEFAGDWPKSHFNLGGLSNHHLKAGSSRYIHYGDDDHLRSKKERPYRLEDLTQCVLDELPDEPVP